MERVRPPYPLGQGSTFAYGTCGYPVTRSCITGFDSVLYYSTVHRNFFISFKNKILNTDSHNDTPLRLELEMREADSDTGRPKRKRFRSLSGVQRENPTRSNLGNDPQEGDAMPHAMIMHARNYTVTMSDDEKIWSGVRW